MLRATMLSLALTVTAASIAPVLGQEARPPDHQACFARSTDQPVDLPNRIAACSRVIANSRAGLDERTEALLRRGFAHAQRAGQTTSKDDIDRALADLAEAGRLVPSNHEVQEYVREARAGLLRLAQPRMPKGAEAGNAGHDLTQVELLKTELQRAQEAAKAMEQRLAALEDATTAKPAPASPTDAAPAVSEPAKLSRDLQSELKRVGCYTGTVDAVWGRMSQQALQMFAQHAAMAIPMGEPTTMAFEAVAARRDRVCPLVCDDHEMEVNGTCVARPRARSKRPYASRRPARSRQTSSEPPSGNPSIGITIGVGRRGGIGIGF